MKLVFFNNEFNGVYHFKKEAFCLNNIFKKPYFSNKFFQVNVNKFSQIFVYENYIFKHKLRMESWFLRCEKIHYFQIIVSKDLAFLSWYDAVYNTCTISVRKSVNSVDLIFERRRVDNVELNKLK